MHIQQIAIDALKPNPRNARTHPKQQIAQLVATMRLLGFLSPILADENRMVLAGHARLLAAKQLGLSEVDSKLRGCDVVAIKVEDVAPNGYAVDRATVRQRKTGRPVRFELTEHTRQAIDAYLKSSRKKSGEFLFTGPRSGQSMTPRQYGRLMSSWLMAIGLDPHLYGTHSLRRTKATLIYRRTGNLRAVQLLLGHTKIESTVRYLGIDVDDALTIAEQVDV